MTKVVTFRASSIGDCLMGKYLLDNIHTAYPSARCYLVVASRGEMIRDLLRPYPWITVLVASRRKPFALIRAFFELRGAELCVTQYSMGGRFSFATKLFARLIAKRGGLGGFEDGHPLNRWLYDKIAEYDPERPVFMHEQDILRRFSVPITLAQPDYFPLDDPQLLSRFSLLPGSYLVAHLYSGSETRGLSPEKRREIAAVVSRTAKTQKLTVLVTGTVREGELAADAFGDAPFVSLAGRTTVQELAGILRHSKLVVSLDTGVAHLAAQMGKPLVVLSSYQALNWWSREQYGSHVRVVTGTRGMTETKKKDRLFPESLNSVSLAQLESILSDFSIYNHAVEN